MKIRVTLKDPDSMDDAVVDALKALHRPDGIREEEWHEILEERAHFIQSEISEKWMKWGEYLVVDFTIGDEDDEAQEATVIPNSANGL